MTGGIEQVLQEVDERILTRFERMRCAPTSQAMWVHRIDTAVDVLVDEGVDYDSWTALEEHLSELLNEKLPDDGSQVLWRMNMMTYKGTETIIFFRWHHTIGDGMAIGELLGLGFVFSVCCCTQCKISLASLDDSIDFSKRPTLSSWTLEHLWLLVWVIVGAFFVLIRWTWLKFTFPRQPRAFKVRLTGQKRLAVSQEPIVSMETLRRARTLGTVNDIVLTAVNRGLARCCDGDVTNLACAIPQNIRWSLEPRPILQNGVGSMSLFLPVIKEEESFAVSVRRMASATRFIKKLPEAYVVGSIMQLSNYLSRAYARKLFSSMSALMSIMCSNVVGHPVPLRLFGGKKCKLLMGFVPAPNGIPVGIGILSYAGGLYLSVNCDVAFTLRTPRQLLECIESELRDNLQSLNNT